MSEHEGIEYSALELNKKDNIGHEGPGSRLKLTRQAKNIDFIEMAKQLRLTPQRLEQLESDDYSAMGSGTYARGYLRGYARSLGMEEAEINELMLLFHSLNFDSSIPSNKPQLINERIEHSNPRTTRRLILFLTLGLAVVLAFWWHKHSLSTDKALLEKTAAASPAETKSEAVIMPLPTQQSPAATSNTTTQQVLPMQTVDNNLAAPDPIVTNSPTQMVTGAENPANQPATNEAPTPIKGRSRGR